MQKKWQCRVAPSLGGGFSGTPNEVWGTKDYTNDTDPAVFFGLYGLRDFFALWNHKGPKAILWAGSDISHFINGYWLDDTGDICFLLGKYELALWIDKYCDNWVENELERKELESVGIQAVVCPSYLGDVNKIKPCYKPSKNPKAYMSVSGDNFELYGWDRIEEIAKKYPKYTFYLYGNKQPFEVYGKNIVVRGRVPQEVMNKEIKQMQCGVRLNKHDGFSEIVAKAVLMEQEVISEIDYPFLRLGRKKAREWLLKNVNRYPWAK